MQMLQFTLDDYEERFADRHRLHDVVAKWAAERPGSVALLSADGSRTVTWAEFERSSTALAGELLQLGFSKGDFLVTLLPTAVDHVLLEYGCFKIGVVMAPLDLRLGSAEVVRILEILRPRGLTGLGVSAPFDFREIWRAVQAQCTWIEHSFAQSTETIPGTLPLASLFDAARDTTADADRMARACAAVAAAGATVRDTDGALVIFTTGSTGSPKPALLSHRNITVQNMCMSGGLFGGDHGVRTLVHLPPSHVGCQTEMLMSTLFGGGSVVLMEMFDAARTMRAVEQHRVEIFAQIPAMFNLVWLLRDYNRYDLSSVKFVAFGGNSVSSAFVERVAAMAPLIGTGLGLTECAGFCTYVMGNAEDHEEIASSLGHATPVYPCSIREPMRDDGSAGNELPEGQIGHVCFRGPQTFLGYINDPAATAKAISSEGWLYTGDLGFLDAAGLHLSGRAKWVIKSMGYQIFPGDVESHICALSDKIASSIVVGAPHEVVAEAVVALVEKRPGAELSAAELDRHARTLPPYMRPRHWIVMEPGTMPLNRVAKPDYLRAHEIALREVERLRAQGEWDSGYARSSVKLP